MDPQPNKEQRTTQDLERTATADVRLAALSLPARLVISLVVGVVAVYTAFHMATVFLFVAPSNHVREEYGDRIDGYIYPEFEQTWKLFAPNPLQRNVAIEARAEVREPDGGRHVTDWISITAMDVGHVRHNPMPSHTAQNEMRRAWDFYTGSHDETTGEPVGLRGELSEIYVHRIALLRLDQSGKVDAEDVERLQLRSATTLVPPPEWAQEDVDTSTSYHQLDWWVVTTQDVPSGVLASNDGDDSDNDGEGVER